MILNELVKCEIYMPEEIGDYLIKYHENVNILCDEVKLINQRDDSNIL